MTTTDPGWGHYDGCPLAHDHDTTTDDDCICHDLAVEYADERQENQ